MLFLYIVYVNFYCVHCFEHIIQIFILTKTFYKLQNIFSIHTYFFAVIVLPGKKVNTLQTNSGSVVPELAAGPSANIAPGALFPALSRSAIH